jgi:lipopolysaccharide heptosyltransferase III
VRRLLIRPGAIGDVIVSLPALEFLKAEYTEVWVPTAVVPLIHFADKVVSISASRIDVMADGFAERFRVFDEVVSWYGSNKESLEALNPRCVFHKALPPKDWPAHATDFYARQVGAPLGLAPKITVKQVVTRETVVIHPFSGSAGKNWPIDSYLRLAERLPLPVEWAQERFESLLDLAEWIAGARLYIGNDSGISHLAAAVGIPTIAIFGPSDPKIWGPMGGQILGNPTIDEVLNAASEQLACVRR